MKNKRFAVYAWATIAYNLAVILWGAYVRASGSGAGCGAHWPLCNGEVIPRTPEAATVVEFTHRLTSGLALLLVVGLVVWALRAYEKGHAVRKLAVLSLVFIVFEALIGAGIVLFEYVAENKSVARAVWMAVHLVNTFLLLGALTLTAWRASAEHGRLRVRGVGPLAYVLGVALFGTLMLAMSGAVAALGDTLFPVATLSEGIRQDLSPTAHALVRLRLMHPILALFVGGFLLFTASYVTRAPQGVWIKRWAGSLAALVLVQLLVGALNVALLAPVWLQLVHLLLADLTWIALVLLSADALASNVRAAEGFETASLPSTAES